LSFHEGNLYFRKNKKEKTTSSKQKKNKAKHI